MSDSQLERDFLLYWRAICDDAPDPVAQHYGIPGRLYRFDFAWPDAMVAVELQGGTWVRGRHTRGAGYRNDCEKLNLAQHLGWRVFYLTRQMLEGEPVRWLILIRDLVKETE